MRSVSRGREGKDELKQFRDGEDKFGDEKVTLLLMSGIQRKFCGAADAAAKGEAKKFDLGALLRK